MSYIDAINYLYGLQKYGIKLGLEKTERVLHAVDNPHRDFLSVHVAGTNGKGSVSAMTASILMAHGYKVGLFTSPHLVSFTERIRINNEQISESAVVSLTNEIRVRMQTMQTQNPELIPTFFEFVTAMAFLYFSRNNVDWAVVETGMGGRLDATNLVVPEVSVITKIGYDHKEFLGETLKDIAAEKAGIIKKGVPVVSAMQESEAEEIIHAAAIKKSSPLFIYGKDFNGALKSSDLNGIIFDYSELRTPNSELTNLSVPLAGEHQLFNACLAIKAATIALKRVGHGSWVTGQEKIKDGLSNTKWHGRLEIINDNPVIMIDGAHNPDAAKALSEFIRKHLNDYRIILIMGIMSDKDMDGIMKPLLPVASEIIFTAPNYSRAASPQRLAEYASSIGFDSSTTNSVRDAIEMAKQIGSRVMGHGSSITGQTQSSLPLVPCPLPLILITGSFYTIGEAKEVLGEQATLGTLRETL